MADPAWSINGSQREMKSREESNDVPDEIGKRGGCGREKLLPVATTT